MFALICFCTNRTKFSSNPLGGPLIIRHVYIAHDQLNSPLTSLSSYSLSAVNHTFSLLRSLSLSSVSPSVPLHSFSLETNRKSTLISISTTHLNHNPNLKQTTTPKPNQQCFPEKQTTNNLSTKSQTLTNLQLKN